MTRVNLIPTYQLADQHLIAENHEIGNMFGYYRNHNGETFDDKGHHLSSVIPYFHDKLFYLEKRLNSVQDEMKKRNFCPTITIDLTIYDSSRMNDWTPKQYQIEDLIKRITLRLHQKPNYYRYCGAYQPPEFFLQLMEFEE
jgi:hypothetical protein